jgi:hypothetical protein
MAIKIKFAFRGDVHQIDNNKVEITINTKPGELVKINPVAISELDLSDKEIEDATNAAEEAVFRKIAIINQ